MKKIKYLFLSAIVAVLGVSCNDALDIIQDGELDDQATFQTVDDLFKYLSGSIYGSVGLTNEIMLSAVFTDEVGIGPSNGGQEIDLHRFNLNKSTGYVAGIYGGNYSVINRVNRLLEAAENIVPKNQVEMDKYYSVIAQARALRAYSYMQLSIYFSQNMADENALGVALIDYVPFKDEKLQRVSNSEIFNLIEEDLAFAKDNLGDITVIFDGVYSSPYKYVSVNMINATYARYNLYRERFDLAKYYADLVISTSGLNLTAASPVSESNFYLNTTTNPYRRMWADLNQGEVIFGLSRPSGGIGGNIASSFFFNESSLTGGAFLDMGRNLYNSLATSASDIRFKAFVDPSSRIDRNYLNSDNYVDTDAIIIDKYPGKQGGVLKNDLKAFRLSEMYFISAESSIRQGNLTAAATSIKRVRDARQRAGSSPEIAFSNATEAYVALLDEKRKELCFEGHRYLDIKRLGVLANRSIDRSVVDDIIKNLPLTLPADDYRFTLPIPQAEISANPSMIQNAGYN